MTTYLGQPLPPVLSGASSGHNAALQPTRAGTLGVAGLGFAPLVTAEEFPPTEFCVSAVDLLLEQFRDSERMVTFFCVMAARLQPLRNALQDIADCRRLEVAQGQWLDNIGQLHGPDGARLLRLDEPYRSYLQAMSSAVGSHGSAEDFAQAIRVLDGGAHPSALGVYQAFPMAVIVTMRLNPGVDSTLSGALPVLARLATAATGVQLHYDVDGDTPFGWGETAGDNDDDGNGGWGVGSFDEAVSPKG